MPYTKLQHRPQQVLAAVLVARGLGGDPAALATALAPNAPALSNTYWPVCWSNEPDRPDNAITVLANVPQLDAKTAPDAGLVQHFSLTVRVRGQTDDLVGQKAEDVAYDLNTGLYDQKIVIDGTEYSVPSVRAQARQTMRLQSALNSLWFCNVECLCPILAYPTGRQ